MTIKVRHSGGDRPIMQQHPCQPTERPRLLLVDDDAGARRALQLLLSGRGIQVRAYGAAADLLADPTALGASILIADYRMPGADGLDVLARLRERRWAGRALLITGYPEPGLRAKAKALGYERVLEKPLADAALLKAVDVLMSGPAK